MGLRHFLARLRIYLDNARFFTIDLDYSLGADDSAHCTACAISVVHLGWKIPGFIGAIGDDDAILRAYCCTQSATFAPFDINNYFASHRVFRFTAELAVFFCHKGTKIMIYLFFIFVTLRLRG